jgi:hypothetical protein
MVPYELLQDLNKLVCSSKNKKVEDLFIKLAAEETSERYDGSAFCKWLLKVTGNKDLGNKIDDSETLTALSYLAKNKDKLNDNPNDLLFSESYSRYISVYLGLIKLVNKSSDKYSGLLTPFGPFFRPLSRVSEKNVSDSRVETLNKDLSTILNEYEAYINPPDHYPDHHHIMPHEMNDEEKVRSTFNTLQDTKIYRHLFGYLLHSFTESILVAINKGTPSAWENTKQLLLSRKLPRYGEIMGSLPYIPNMGSSGSKIHELFNSLPRTWRKYGDAETYNIINRKILSALEMPVPYSTTPQQEMNYDDWYNKKGDPNPNFDYNTDQVEKPEAHHVELPYEDVLECSYILCVSALLGKIQERIQNSTE